MDLPFLGRGKQFGFHLQNGSFLSLAPGTLKTRSLLFVETKGKRSEKWSSRYLSEQRILVGIFFLIGKTWEGLIWENFDGRKKGWRGEKNCFLHFLVLACVIFSPQALPKPFQALFLCVFYII